jgi:TRAP-type C4-dicarboxylate transport system permease small subunit
MRLAAWPLLVLEALIALVLFAIMLLTGVDVIGRYGFNRPVGGADEVIATGMALLIFGSLPIVALRSEQITIDTAVGWLGERARDVQARLVNLIGAAVLAYLAWRLVGLAERMSRSGEHSSLLHISYGALAYVLAALAAVAALATLSLVFRRRQA